MKMRTVLVGLLVAVTAGCSPVADERAEKPAFKGMELYSWKPDGKEWHFSLLQGTNRLKSDEEIKQPEQTMVGLEELKRRLARLAEGESVFWRNVSTESVSDDMANDVREFCDGIQVNLERI